MKHYPSITKEVRHDIEIIAFDKIDGSNIRAEWNNKKGFYKFGTKNHLIDANSKPFGISVALIKDKYEADLAKVFTDNKWKDTMCFFELCGASSFAGTHSFTDPLDVTLIDVNPYKQGIISPFQFVEKFGHLDLPKVLYQGRITTDLFDQIKQSTLPGMTFEGVVCKGDDTNKTKMPVMFKIKSKAWLEKLREYCKGNESLFAALE
jgi:hypothetical protein